LVSFGERGDLPSGCDAQHDLAALMWRAAKHFVGNASFFQWEHRADIRNQFSTVEQRGSRDIFYKWPTGKLRQRR
jgi:hypothetical protein